METRQFLFTLKHRSHPLSACKLNREDRECYSRIYCPLSRFNVRCNSIEKSRTPACVSAYHDYCLEKFKHTDIYGGISQDIGARLTVACIRGESYSRASLRKLSEYEPECNHIDKSQSPACVSAIYRWCGGKPGVAQQVRTASFMVLCFASEWEGQVLINALEEKNPKCNHVSKAQSAECLSAAHRWCTAKGTDFKGRRGAIVIRVGDEADTPWLPQKKTDTLFIACFKAAWHDIVPINDQDLE